MIGDERRRTLERRGAEGDPSAALAARLALVRDEDGVAQATRLREWIVTSHARGVEASGFHPWSAFHEPWNLARVVNHTITTRPGDRRRARTYGGSLVETGHRVALVVNVEGLVVIGVGRSPIETIGTHYRWPATSYSPAWLSEVWPELGHRRPALARDRHDKLSAWAFRDASDRVMVREGVAREWARGVLASDLASQPTHLTIAFNRPVGAGAAGSVAVHFGESTARVPVSAGVGWHRVGVGSLVGMNDEGRLEPMREGLSLVGEVRATHPDSGSLRALDMMEVLNRMGEEEPYVTDHRNPEPLPPPAPTP